MKFQFFQWVILGIPLQFQVPQATGTVPRFVFFRQQLSAIRSIFAGKNPLQFHVHKLQVRVSGVSLSSRNYFHSASTAARTRRGQARGLGVSNNPCHRLVVWMNTPKLCIITCIKSCIDDQAWGGEWCCVYEEKCIHYIKKSWKYMERINWKFYTRIVCMQAMMKKQLYIAIKPIAVVGRTAWSIAFSRPSEYPASYFIKLSQLKMWRWCKYKDRYVRIRYRFWCFLCIIWILFLRTHAFSSWHSCSRQ